MPVPARSSSSTTPIAASRRVLDADVTLAIQQHPRGTADAARAGAEDLAAGNTVVVLNGDAPLISAEAISSLVDAHERAVAAATIGTVTLDDASGYGRVVRDPDGMVRARRRDQDRRATRPRPSCRSARSTPGSSPSTATRCSPRLTRSTPHNAQGELYLPDVLPILRSLGRTVIAHGLDDPTEMLGINDRVALADVTARRPAPHPRAPHARRRDDRQPGRDRDRRRRRDRRGTRSSRRSRASTAPRGSARARRSGR